MKFKKLMFFFVLVVVTTACHQVKDTTETTSTEPPAKILVSAAIIEKFEGAERTAKQQPEKVLKLIGDVHGQTIMDLGAGTGYFTFRLVDVGAKVIAADIHDDYLEYIQLKADSLNVRKFVETRKVPKDSPELQPNEIDKLLIVNTYHHLYDRSTYFKKVKAGLKPDGEVIVVDYSDKLQEVKPARFPFLNAPLVIEELKEAGFTDFEVEEALLEDQYIVRAK